MQFPLNFLTGQRIGKDDARDIVLKEFEQLPDEQYGLVEFKFQGMGEALMNAESYLDMIRYARAR